MRKLPVFLALSASVGGAASMILVTIAPRNPSTLPILVVGLIITFGALSSARRFARQSRASS
jgi:hypothetical protein